jgi:uncharacterized membrane protein
MSGSNCYIHILETWCHPQGVKSNKRFVSLRLVVVVVVIVVAVIVVIVLVVVIVVVAVEISSGFILSYEIRFVSLGQDITNNFGSIKP